MSGSYNLLDFMDLSPAERCVVRIILRQIRMTYPELQEAAAIEHIDQAELDTTIDHLIYAHWLSQQVADDQTLYRVTPNAIRRHTSQNQTFWRALDLEQIDQAGPAQLDLKSAESMLYPLGMKRGGKKTLPSHIWEKLDDTPREPPVRKRSTGLFDKLIDDNSPKDQ